MSQKVSLRCKARSLLFPRAHTDPALDVRFFGFFFLLDNFISLGPTEVKLSGDDRAFAAMTSEAWGVS